ncbi:hypothetical protein SAMN04488498_12812 [Mesorhizobium albiziae]|uniref:Methyltransferase, FkbM family n=1 Tax=Neomesorhizobium albiziae TaxID=335020 RepID=A0A1I4EMZ6_9HYPH|nr:hypothetical protein [Mesorhizobium albiziae]GLS31369.1 hypothetical protein GCM10007937_30790 [Mesorhizobium albiziae]SFL06679.1 hypothetical protein SAMN04488498_12812 [Mesorhizobium albiziae]
MLHATWNTIEKSPSMMGLYRTYRRLPEAIRVPARWMLMPRWQLLCASVRRRAMNRVQSGPFAGMNLELTPLSNRNLLGYLLGTHELELHPVVETIIARNYPRIVNIGAADGYYALGLARRMANAVVEAYEALEQHHALLRNAAERNGVADRVWLRGLCTIDSLNESLGDGTGKVFVLADIEGAEMQLLNPVKVPALRKTDMLIETHDVLQPGCSDCLKQRFSETHLIEIVPTRPRKLADLPRQAIPGWAGSMHALLVELMNERRMGKQEWMFLSAKA